QDGIEILRLVHGKQATKAPDFAEHTLGKSFMRQILDALLGAVGLVDVDASIGVSDGFGRILGHGVSGYEVREPDTQKKNFQIVACSAWKKTWAFTTEAQSHRETNFERFLI